MRLVAITLLALTLFGCYSGSGAKWYAPNTWFSGKELYDVQDVQRQEGRREDEAVKAAQNETFKARVLSDNMADGLAKDLSLRFTGNALGLLDTAVGPLTLVEQREARSIVDGLLQGDTDAETQQAKAEASADRLIAELATIREKLRDAHADLQAAYERENRLANEKRASDIRGWVATSLAVVVGIGLLYYKLAYGSMVDGIGSALAGLTQRKHEGLQDFILALDSSSLNGREQERIAASKLTHLQKLQAL